MRYDHTLERHPLPQSALEDSSRSSSLKTKTPHSSSVISSYSYYPFHVDTICTYHVHVASINDGQATPDGSRRPKTLSYLGCACSSSLCCPPWDYTKLTRCHQWYWGYAELWQLFMLIYLRKQRLPTLWQERWMCRNGSGRRVKKSWLQHQ